MTNYLRYYLHTHHHRHPPAAHGKTPLITSVSLSSLPSSSHSHILLFFSKSSPSFFSDDAKPQMTSWLQLSGGETNKLTFATNYRIMHTQVSGGEASGFKPLAVLFGWTKKKKKKKSLHLPYYWPPSECNQHFSFSLCVSGCQLYDICSNPHSYSFMSSIFHNPRLNDSLWLRLNNIFISEREVDNEYGIIWHSSVDWLIYWLASLILMREIHLLPPELL